MLKVNIYLSHLLGFEGMLDKPSFIGHCSCSNNTAVFFTSFPCGIFTSFFTVASNTANNCINFKRSRFNLGSKSCRKYHTAYIEL